MSEPVVWRLPHSHTCFVCGESNRYGLDLRLQTDGRRVWSRFTPVERYMGYAGITHGGIITAALDEIMGWGPTIRTGRFCMAVDLHIQLRKSLPIGKEVTVLGEATDVSRRIWEGRGEIRDGDGTIYVLGTGRFMPMSREETDRVMDMLIFDEGTIPRELLARGIAPESSAQD